MLFEYMDVLDGGVNFRFVYCREGGAVSLVGDSRYPMLFVLQGELTLRFGYYHRQIESDNLIVLDTEALSECQAKTMTVILIYTPPQRLAQYFGHCCRAFNSPYSPLVPILSPLQYWIDDLLMQLNCGACWNSEEAHQQRRELASIFTSVYPRRILGELYAPFYVCTQHDCQLCRQSVALPETDNAKPVLAM